ncbi:hypothetical protein EUX98_g3011 [Antrodiella citrinella]|uniref:Methyltransferase type 11 domain-containing protein n=1 Tax=Antrodiella citrinella TaxID=2447956 RepID=A0A4S4MXL5_9APHY|nr:hypothetical protein EUX98_g3011 [Antrodiella citrinella]
MQFTAEAFKTRTTLSCSTWTFQDIADGALADQLKDSAPVPHPVTSEEAEQEAESDLPNQAVEMTICSFALHLIDSPSELFALLWEISLRSRWLVVLAPHKKPEMKLGWGWVKWDADEWTECPMTRSDGEFLQDRVHCRVYRSVNIP